MRWTSPDDSYYFLHVESRDPPPRFRLFAVGLALGAAFLAGTCVDRLGRALAVPLLTTPKQPVVDVLGHCIGESSAIKRTVCSMDHALVSLNGGRWQDYSVFTQTMHPFWDERFTYTPMYGIDESVGLESWFRNEMSAWSDAFPWVEFNQMIFLGSGPNATTTTYAVGDWKGALGPLTPTDRRMTVRITDFYVAASDGRIAQNYMMIDLLDLLRQQGIRPLPLSPLKQGHVSPPQGDGIPAPLTKYANDEDASDARRVVEAMLNAEWVGTSTALEHWRREEFVWYGPVPFGMATSADEYTTHFLKPFHSAFPSERALVIDTFACEGQYCGAHGTFSGRHAGASWLGFAPSGKLLSLDFGMHWRVVDGKISEGWAIFDLPRMLLPLGVDLLRDDPSPPQLQSSAAKATASSTSIDDVDAPTPADNNQCSNAYTQPPGGAEVDSTSFDCPAFVIASTDATWHTRNWELTNKAVDTYFSEDWQSVRAFGLMLRGREALRSFMKDWLGGFPDVYIHVADVFCLGNEAVGFKTTMPYVLTATHTGWSKAFGAPSGRKVSYHGIANCYIKKIGGQWQYTREWDLPDMWAFLTALNISANALPHPSADLVPVDQCKPLFEWGGDVMNWFPASA